MKKSDSPNILTIGSRQSDLARLQAITVGEILRSNYPDIEIEFFNRPSFGDLNLDMNLKETNSKGVFTQEFKDLLKNKQCDFVVHSWKDLPIENDPLTEIMTLSKREDQRDLLFLKKTSIDSLKNNVNKNLIFLTSSPRREYSLKKTLQELLPFKVQDVSFEAIRGNIPTRFSKFLQSNADGFVVAKAAVDRLMSTETLSCANEFKEIRQQILQVFNYCKFMVLPLSEFPTAAAQGALAIEILRDHPFKNNLKKMASQKNYDLVELERQTHKKYGGGCHQAMGFSALPVDEGTVFYSSGEHGGESFKTGQFFAKKELKAKFSKEQLFSQSSLNFLREKNKFNFKKNELDFKISSKSEFVITRFESRIEDLKDSECVVWSAGTKTWMKLAKDGYWVNGSLDGLGLDHKPDLEYLKTTDHVWLTNNSSLGISNTQSVGKFKMLSTYELEYELATDKESLMKSLESKECFYWMSGNGFESLLNIYPKLITKIHFCGLGRTADVLKRHLKEDQIYYCLNESDFIRKCTVKDKR